MFDCCEDILGVILTIFGILVGIGVIYGICVIAKKVSDDNAAERRRIEAQEEKRRKDLQEAKENFNHQVNNISTYVDLYLNGTFDLDMLKQNFNSTLEDMKKWKGLTSSDTSFYHKAQEKYEYCKSICGQLYEFFNAINTQSMLQNDSYGSINKDYYNSIISSERLDVETSLTKIESIINRHDYQALIKIDVGSILRAVWYYALTKPFSQSDFEKAEKLYLNFTRNINAAVVEVFIAEIFAINQMGAKNVVNDKIRKCLDKKKIITNQMSEDTVTNYGGFILEPKKNDVGNIENGVTELTKLASALMWIKAYDEEKLVLQHMVSHNFEMSPKLQERLHSLSNGGGEAPASFDVESTHEEIYMDISSLSWKPKEIEAFFENLIFQEKPLTYSLAIREETKDLMVPASFAMPDLNVVYNSVYRVFNEEYGTEATVNKINCVLVSGVGKEKIKGFLVKSLNCEQMAIFVNIAKIGKKLNIKFYVQYVPTSNDVLEQKQQVLSLHNSLSPSVTMWETSLKDTVLDAIQQILNSTPVSNNTSDIPDTPVGTKDVIF